MSWPFGDLQPLSYDVICIDCPWTFELYSEAGDAKSAQAHYDCMPLDAIKALPVGHLARGDAVLFMWATWPLLPQAIEVMAGWGFRYTSGGVWHKRTKHGLSAFGTGYRLRSASEPWLLGTVGNPRTSRSHRNVIEGVVRQHSRKPEEAYQWLEGYLPGARRADLFARQQRPNWESWGWETNKFSSASDAPPIATVAAVS